jgi:RNA polymerase sigma-70 factor (ECF subfamily)
MSVQLDESLWQTYRAQLFRFVLRRVEDHDTAEDIVHDVLLRAYDRRDTLRDSGRFEPWLYQVTRNAIIDHYRRRRPSDPLPDDLAVADEAQSGSARRELAACMQPFIDALPDHYRSAISLSEIQGLTQQQTADQLGISLSGAKSRVQRGRRMLEDRLLDCCRIEVDGRGSIADYEKRNGNSCDC